MVNLKKRIYTQENPNVRWDYDGENAVMYVCGKPYSAKESGIFNETKAKEMFEDELGEVAGVSCDTFLERWEEEEEEKESG